MGVTDHLRLLTDNGSRAEVSNSASLLPTFPPPFRGGFGVFYRTTGQLRMRWKRALAQFEKDSN